jgi:phosphodiesterase/alkaline phosphatase D-like protein
MLLRRWLTSPGLSYPLQAEVDGLKSSTAYWFQFEYGGKYSEVGTTRTLPKRGPSKSPVSREPRA